MRTFTNTRVARALLLAGGASIIAMATPAMAQDAEAEEEDRIVVTGSRITAPGNFESTSPMVTIGESLLEQSSTAAIETQLNRLPQFVPAQTPFAGGDIQPTATNTPGAATISLRGIGANRNLVLIDGRRGTPGNATGVVDISTIPSAAIERIEVISGGASATYGADAVAGVTNFILKKNFEGLELDAQLGMTQEGDGFEYQLSGIMGADFADGRGNVSIAMSINTREASYQRDRSWYQDLWTDPNIAGTQFFIDRPGINFGFGNLPNFETVFGAAAPSGIFDPELPGGGPEFGGAFGQTIYTTESGNGFTTGFGSPWGLSGWDGDTAGLPHKRTANGALSQNNTNVYLILPLTRYNGFARGNYEINDWVGVFGQMLFSHVETFTRNEPGPIFAGWGVDVDPDSLDEDQLPDDLWTLLNSRADPGAPFTLTALLPNDRETFTDVTTYNLIAGLEGTVPGTDFVWEAFVSHGFSETFARQTGVYSLERMRTVLQSGNFGEGFSATGNPGQGGFGASTATCTSGLNFYLPPTGGFSQDCLDAVRADLKNRSEMRQTIAEANINGGLFDLPAGTMRFALGFSYREQEYEFLNDTLTTQGTSFQDQALGIYPSGDAFGYIDTHEVYGELLIPVLSDIPMIEQFNIELGGRYSDYSTTGSSYTYKILADWEVTDWLRLRGGYNRAERAPNIGELYLAAQQTFGFNFAGDLCAKGNPLPFSANDANANGDAVEAVCRVLMNQSGDPTADDFFYQQDGDGVYINGAGATGTFGFAFPTTVGNPNLTPETADTWTAGFVLQPYFGGAVSRARLTVDWFSIKVNDAIGVQSVAVAQRQCLDPIFNPAVLTDATAAANNQFCDAITRNTQNGGLGNVFVTYVNNGRFHVSGVDVALDLGFDVGPGTLNLNVLGNYQLGFKVAELPTDPMVDYTGTTGTTANGLNNGAYEYRVLTTLGYTWGAASLGIQWQHLSGVEDSTEASFPTPTTGYPSYNLFDLNGTYALSDSVNLRFGVQNLFNKAPPLGNINTANTSPATNGQLSGGSYNALFYDTNGRRFYLGANFQF